MNPLEETLSNPCKALLPHAKRSFEKGLQGDVRCKALLPLRVCKECDMQSSALQGMRHAKLRFARIAPSYKAELCMQSKAKHGVCTGGAYKAPLCSRAFLKL